MYNPHSKLYFPKTDFEIGLTTVIVVKGPKNHVPTDRRNPLYITVRRKL